jgi:hypothetical protein
MKRDVCCHVPNIACLLMEHEIRCRLLCFEVKLKGCRNLVDVWKHAKTYQTMHLFFGGLMVVCLTVVRVLRDWAMPCQLGVNGQ